MVYKIYPFCTLIVVEEIIRIAPVVGVKERRRVEAGESVFKESEGFRRQDQENHQQHSVHKAGEGTHILGSSEEKSKENQIRNNNFTDSVSFAAL